MLPFAQRDLPFLITEKDEKWKENFHAPTLNELDSYSRIFFFLFFLSLFCWITRWCGELELNWAMILSSILLFFSSYSLLLSLWTGLLVVAGRRNTLFFWPNSSKELTELLHLPQWNLLQNGHHTHVWQIFGTNANGCLHRYLGGCVRVRFQWFLKRWADVNFCVWIESVENSGLSRGKGRVIRCW